MITISKNRKALSPVVAAIILIAVAVAVSIAVAAWMGALTFTFMATEEIEILGCTFNDITPKSLTLAIKNTGTTDLTVSKYKIGVGESPIALNSTISVAQGVATNVNLPLDWVSGQTYDIYLITATVKQFPYRAVAP